jgi:hypothetical protein
MGDWTDRIVGDRMSVDQQFTDRVAASEFSNQEWGLIMTATTFEIRDADDPDRARIVANTDNVPHVMPELEKVRQGMGGMGGGPAGGGGNSGGGGFLGSVKDALGFGGDDHQDKIEAAERLTQEYAEELQKHLKSKGKWDQVLDSYEE